MQAMLRITVVFLTLILAQAAQASEYEIRAPGKVVAFGDVHGAYDDWVALLKELGIIDNQLNWAAGNTHLVSLGDLIDRGPGSRDVVRLMMKLEKQAADAGGAVHLVLGNHEVMVMLGDLRYVSREEFAAFARDETPAQREQLYADYRRFNPGGDDATVRATFDQQYPPGFAALRQAYSRQGTLGWWLSQKPFVIKVNDKVYMHGGISKAAASNSLDQLNTTLRKELQGYMNAAQALREAGQLPLHVSFDHRLQFLNARVEEFVAANPKTRAPWFDQVQFVFEGQEALLLDSDNSPQWYRGSSLCHPLSESWNTERFLKTVGAKQLVVGHEPRRVNPDHRGKAQLRMEGLVVMLDTGMLRKVYKGRAAAMVTEGGKSYIQYLGDGQRRQPVPELTSLSKKLSGMADVELEDFMRTAPITNVEDIGTGITKPKRVTQERDGIVNDSAFKYEDTHPGLEDKKKWITRKFNQSDRYIYDVAAYKLDRMLDWQMVPVSVLSEVDGDKGALSDWVENTINERDRLEQELPFNSYCKQWEQYRLRFVFDILIHNDDRNLTNILWTKDDYMMKFIDHSLAFRSTEKRPKQYKKVDVEISDLLYRRLQGLSEENLNAELSPYLHPRQIEAILARRDLLLKEAVRSAP